MLKVIVLYPQPTDVEKFEADYANHFPPYYKMFTMPFDSPEALQATMASGAMQEVAADANRISTGGTITVLIASEE